MQENTVLREILEKANVGVVGNIGTEHILLALFRCKDPEMDKIFQDLGINEEKIFSVNVMNSLIDGGKIDIAKLSLSGRAKKIIEDAEKIAESESKEFCPRHLFIALIRDGDGVGALVLQEILHLNKVELADKVQLSLLY